MIWGYHMGTTIFGNIHIHYLHHFSIASVYCYLWQSKTHNYCRECAVNELLADFLLDFGGMRKTAWGMTYMIIKVILFHFDVYCSVHLRPEGGFSMAMLVSGRVCGSFLLVNPVAAARISLGSKKAVVSESGRLFSLQDPIDWRLVKMAFGVTWLLFIQLRNERSSCPILDGWIRDVGRNIFAKNGQVVSGFFLLEKLLPKFQWQSWYKVITGLVATQTFFMFTSYLGRWSNLTSIFFKWVGSTTN